MQEIKMHLWKNIDLRYSKVWAKTFCYSGKSQDGTLLRLMYKRCLNFSPPPHWREAGQVEEVEDKPSSPASPHFVPEEAAPLYLTVGAQLGGGEKVELGTELDIHRVQKNIRAALNLSKLVKSLFEV